MIHVSGVGLLGSFLLRDLHARELPFTWDDCESRFTAWGASTGAVIPCENRDLELYAAGYRKWRDDATKRPALQPFLEPVETIYVMKAPPQRVTRKWKPIVFGVNSIWRESLPGWQFDVGRFIESTRKLFAAERRPGPVSAERTIRCRGVMEASDSPVTVWGWRVPVNIKPKANCQVWSKNGLRPVIHFNDPDRSFERYYFHPLAGSPDVWWAGSEAVLQKRPQSLVERSKIGFANYLKTVERRFGDQLEVKQLGPLVEGWRAKPKLVHKRFYAKGLCRQVEPGVFVAMPLYKSGVQCGPLYSEVILEEVLR